MSLTVPNDLLEKARRGPVTDLEFVSCIRDSLPYAWQVVERLAGELDAGDAPSAENVEVPPDEAARGQLLRLVGSDAMRGAVERHFGVRLAFQNCHKVGLFRPAARAEFAEFVSPRAQLLNQSPELVDC